MASCPDNVLKQHNKIKIKGKKKKKRCYKQLRVKSVRSTGIKRKKKRQAFTYEFKYQADLIFLFLGSNHQVLLPPLHYHFAFMVKLFSPCFLLLFYFPAKH